MEAKRTDLGADDELWALSGLASWDGHHHVPVDSVEPRAAAVPLVPTVHPMPRSGGGLGSLVGTSPAMQEVYRVAGRVAPTRAAVLITGESGTGKGELAKIIHATSSRASGPFVQLQCASLTESLLESELLRVLQEKTFERVGGNETVRVDVRVIAATNRDVLADVAAGRFRQDLFYRLKVVQIDMPPLRARGGDILLLADHFLYRFGAENDKPMLGFNEAARAKLISYGWPGNVRELENAVEHAVVLGAGPTVEARDLPSEITPTAKRTLQIPGATMAEVERYVILSTLEACKNSTSKAAELLQISARTIQYRLHEYGVADAIRRQRTSGPG